MLKYKVGSVVVFYGYCEEHPEVPDVFHPGDLLQIVKRDAEGAYTAVLLGKDDLRAPASDLVFDEEIGPALICIRLSRIMPASM